VTERDAVLVDTARVFKELFSYCRGRGLRVSDRARCCISGINCYSV